MGGRDGERANETFAHQQHVECPWITASAIFLYFRFALTSSSRLRARVCAASFAELILEIGRAGDAPLPHLFRSERREPNFGS